MGSYKAFSLVSCGGWSSLKCWITPAALPKSKPQIRHRKPATTRADWHGTTFNVSLMCICNSCGDDPKCTSCHQICALARCTGKNTQRVFCTQREPDINPLSMWYKSHVSNENKRGSGRESLSPKDLTSFSFFSKLRRALSVVPSSSMRLRRPLIAFKRALYLTP